MFIDVGHYQQELSAYEQLVKTFNYLEVSVINKNDVKPFIYNYYMYSIFLEIWCGFACLSSKIKFYFHIIQAQILEVQLM